MRSPAPCGVLADRRKEPFQMAYENPDNVLILETTKGRVVIRLRPKR